MLTKTDTKSTPIKWLQYPMGITVAGWPHSSQNEIPRVFPELWKFSLCYFYAKLTISSVNKGHIATALLHTEAYKLIF